MTYHFIGIGGIGMSALARILLKQGFQVTGSDTSRSAVIEELENEGAKIFQGHKEEHVNDGIVIYGSAIQVQNPEFAKAKRLGMQMMHRSDLLDHLTREKLPIFVTGTHGKTTTTALLASVLMSANSDPSFVVGGIIQNLQVNGRDGNGPYFIAEADESDGSFLKTTPFGAIVTNCENDHLDYWHTEEKINQGFRDFLKSVKSKEHLFWCKDDARLCSFKSDGFSYGFSKDADLKILQWRQEPNGVLFDLEFQGKRYTDISLSLLGQHNVLNGAAVFGLCIQLKISEGTVRQAFAWFSGVKRRLEKKAEAHGVVCFDDYGHHPTEIQATLKALRTMAGERRIVVLFQPHRFSRTRDLWNDFLTSFKDADVVVVTDIYGAGENPIDGITGQNLAIEMGAMYGEENINLRPFDVFLTLGAGDVTHRGIPILKEYEKKAPKLKVGVISGGTSPEHPISLISARNITQSLDPTFYDVISFLIPKTGDWVTPFVFDQLMSCDVVIPAMHGPQGEDGMIQGFLQTLGIPYVGCDYASCALCMNKAWTKQVASAHGIPIVPYRELDHFGTHPDFTLDIPFPVWVKPVHLGSSIGVSRATNPEELENAIKRSFSLDDQIIIEKEVKGREIEFAVLGNEHPRVTDPCEILNEGAFYDYEKKYGTFATGVEIPAKLTESQTQIGKELAIKAYKAARCKGLTRVDFFLDENGNFYLNEMNPFPGFTANSAYPKMWEKSGLSQKELINELVILAFSKVKT
ncbi:MAG TPA: UDP-N-acetylmuramate--L-alanine ligase [Chlamydiales bacterium]|nr:UDP-N-acetylmuramate--L-alanine ligase [Chlamydiales bacterium]